MTGFGIIGSGMIARFHAEAIQQLEGAQLVGIYGRNTNSVVELAVRYNCEGYTNLDNFLSEKKIDIVTIATPSGAHMEPCIASAEAGKHIICEKPLEINQERIAAIIKVCNDNEVVLSGIFNRRFNPAVVALKKAIEQGRFGKLTLCSAYIKWYRDQAYYDSGAWRGTKELDGGGVLMNQSIHTIDLLQNFVGPIARISGDVACLTHQNIEVEDNAVAMLQFSNGARGVIEASTSVWSSEGHPAEIHICGSEGSVFLKDDRFSVWEFKDERQEDEVIRNTLMSGSEGGLGANDPAKINVDGHVENFRNVIESIDNGVAPLVSGEEALKSVNIINAIYKSANHDGKWINLAAH